MIRFIRRWKYTIGAVLTVVLVLGVLLALGQWLKAALFLAAIGFVVLRIWRQVRRERG